MTSHLKAERVPPFLRSRYTGEIRLRQIPQAVPTIHDKNFAGWSLSQDGGDLIDENTKFYSDTTLYAVYSASNVTVSFVTNCEQELPAQTVAFGEAVSEPEGLVNDGYVFDGWFTEETFQNEYDFSQPVVQDITLYAKWHKEKITVTFNTDGGSEIAPVEQAYGTLVDEPEDPTKENCIFGGWFTDEERTQAFDFSVAPVDDITLYAKWYKNEYTVTFETNGGNAINPITVNYNQTFEMPETPVKEGHTFVNWYTTPDFAEIYISGPVNEDLTLYAKWSVDEYVISFETNGGRRIKDITVKYGAVAEAPDAPEKEGYVFEGWYTDEDLTQEFEFGSPITSNIKLYAKWSETPAEDPNVGLIVGLCVGGVAVVGIAVGVALIVRKKKNEK